MVKATTSQDNPGLDGCPCTHAPARCTFNRRQPVVVRPSEIRAGDGLQDLGRLRRVEHVQTTDNTISPDTVISVHFDDAVDGRYTSLSIHGDVDVVVWRVPGHDCT